jgi:hypothetical protein
VAVGSVNGTILGLLSDHKGVLNIHLTKYILDIMQGQGIDAEKDKLRDLTNTDAFTQISLRHALQALLETYLK